MQGFIFMPHFTAARTLPTGTGSCWIRALRVKYTFRNSPYKHFWFGKLENLVNVVLFGKVNDRYGTNVNELCMKNTTPVVGTAGQEFLNRSKVQTSNDFLFAFSSLIQTRIHLRFGLYFDYFANLNSKSNDSHELQICTIRLMVQT